MNLQELSYMHNLKTKDQLDELEVIAFQTMR